MVTAQQVWDGVLAKLDAQGTDRYLFDLDGVPAINSAVSALTAQIALLYAENKASEESLREMLREQVYQTNSYGRIRADESAGAIWAVMASYCEFTTIPASATVTALPEHQSAVRADVSRNSQGRPVKRYTQEQTAKLMNNSFAAGSEALAANNSLREYGYCIIGDLTSSGYPVGGWEIEYYPKSRSATAFVAISVLRTPDPVTVPASTIPMPSALLDILINKTLEQLAVKQGDNTTLWAVSNQMVAERLQSAR